MTNCALADNVVQARYEFDRAVLFGTEADLNSWARTWGEDLLRQAEAQSERYSPAPLADFLTSTPRAITKPRKPARKRSRTK